MSEQNQKQKEADIYERPNNLLRLIYALLFLLVISLVIWRIFFYKSAREQLAAFNTAQAIPDSENAATIYLQLFADYNESEVKPAFLTFQTEDIANSGPWASKDYPELTMWIQEHQQPIIEKLIQASKLGECYFPVVVSSFQDYESRVHNLQIIRKLAYMLIRSANNDISEGRLDEALEKYICCIRLGRHFRQQPLAIDFLVGIAIEALGLQKIRYLIMHEDVTEEHLKTIETTLPDTKFQLDEYWKVMLQVENLFGRIMPQTPSSSNLLTRLKEWWANIGNTDADLVRVKELYLRLLAERQGSQILVALRHYKNKTGQWPEKLDEIKPFLTSEDILIDPQNNSLFKYQLYGNDFSLYSTKGLTIWPLQTPQTQNQITTIQQTDPNEE